MILKETNTEYLKLDEPAVFIRRQKILDSLDTQKSIILLKKEEEYFQSNPEDMSYLTGGSGLVFLYLDLFEKTKNNSYLEKSKYILLNNYADFLNNKYAGNGLYKGKSGLLLTAFYFYLFSQDEKLIPVLQEILEFIFEDCILTEEKYAVWYNPLQLVTKPLCSFGHGVSGIAYVLSIINSSVQDANLSKLIDKINGYIYETLGEEIDVFCDFRREILNSTDLELFKNHLINKGIDVFEKGEKDYSIEHGRLGILFYKAFDKHSMSELETVFGRQDANQQANSVKSTLQYLLKVNETNENKNFLLPYLNPDTSLNLNQKAFVDSTKFYESLIKSNYKKTFRYLKSINQDFQFKTVNFDLKSIILNEVDAVDHINNILANCEYDENFIYKRYTVHRNVRSYISSVLAQDRIMESLSILDDDLLNKKLIFKKKNEIKTFYCNSNGEVKQQFCIWKYSSEEGIEEYVMDMMSFILNRFNKIKSIRQVLYEMILYCKLSGKKKLKPLIDYSNSKNKEDLILRLPFLFVYQIRVLIKDGILEYVEEGEKKFTTLEALLFLILKSLRVNTIFNTTIKE
ncbi:lanthionine synthetase LanC family protein [Croceitalea marina]|uniref:Lanthionine synthetase LanC family protein n=1 Tax=Croceitalea marina TaxID=1775166 RepID=A0ABW5N0B4_9FLAO